MGNVMTILKKQGKDTFKNKTILIQFLMFPLMTLVMENAVKMDGMPELFFTKLFSVMYVGMAPLTAVSSIIAEEKEKNTLRVLMMANVKPWQYLIGIGIYVWTICMFGAGVMATGLQMAMIPTYLGVMGVGFILSILTGACIGIYANNQMGAASLVMPVMLILAFLPMIAQFNERIEKVANLFFTQQLGLLLKPMSLKEVTGSSVGIICGNTVLLLVLFVVTYRRKGLD